MFDLLSFLCGAWFTVLVVGVVCIILITKANM